MHDPIPAYASPAAIAPAVPLLDPPHSKSVFHAFRVGAKCVSSVGGPYANSYVPVFPITIAPASFSFFTEKQSSAATYPSSVFDPQVVGPLS